MRSKTIEELRDIAEGSLHVKEAITAAKWVLEERGVHPNLDREKYDNLSERRNPKESLSDVLDEDKLAEDDSITHFNLKHLEQKLNRRLNWAVVLTIIGIFYFLLVIGYWFL